MIQKYFENLFLPSKFYLTFSGLIVLFILSFLYPPLFLISKFLVLVFIILFILDYSFLFFILKKPSSTRFVTERLSNSDENKIELEIKNNSIFFIFIKVIDEIPFQFQIRNWQFKSSFKANEVKHIQYKLRPIYRGEYQFGNTILYIQSIIGLVIKRQIIEASKTSLVYPSFLQLKKAELISKSTLLAETGAKQMRKIGSSMEFEHIKEYIIGDDIRNINWKATARKNSLMINKFIDEKSQQVYCIIDKGRLMKMPFANLTLLDYAINSTLALASVCLQKQDRIGLLTFSNKMGTLLQADKKPIQREHILQALYKQSSDFLESDFEMLYLQVRNNIKQRSLLILYTNFESLSGLKRQINYLRSIAKYHLLLVVFFENTELAKLTKINTENMEEIYTKVIAEKFAFEKRLIIKELKKYGILTLLTDPKLLTVHTINKYIELKAKQAL